MSFLPHYYHDFTELEYSALMIMDLKAGFQQQLVLEK